MADESPDIERIPNFEALRTYLNDKPKRENVLKWVGKLEAWCTEIREELTKHDKTLEERNEEIDKLGDRIEELESELYQFQRFDEDIEDVERGVLTFAEFMDRRRRVYL